MTVSKMMDRTISVNITDEVRNLAVALPVGGRSIHLLCPQCNGGTHRERSFVIARKGGALFYKCYRNKCGFSGKIASKGGDIIGVAKEKPADEYEWETENLTEAQILFLENEYELSADTVVKNRVKYVPGLGKYAFPIFDVTGREVGLVDRRFVGDKKSRTYWFDKTVPRVHFPRDVHPSYKRRIIVVEDVISSEKINQLGMVAVCALLGTGVNDKLMEYLASLTDGITFMLDPDAIKTALSYRRRYNAFFKHPIAAVQLRADPKDTPLKKLEEIIY